MGCRATRIQPNTAPNTRIRLMILHVSSSEDVSVSFLQIRNVKIKDFLWRKVRLAYPGSLQALHSNNEKKCFKYILLINLVHSVITGKSQTEALMYWPSDSKLTMFITAVCAASYPDVSLLMKMCAQRKAGRRQAPAVCTLPMVPCGSSPVTRFALASPMLKTKRLRRRLAVCV